MGDRVEMTALITARQGMGDLLRDALKELAAETVKEPGCIVFRVFEAYSAPDRFVLWEIFADEQALRLHMEAPYTRAHFQNGLTESTEVVRVREL